MNRAPDVERVLRDYFSDDGSAAPDHILDVVEARIARHPRRLAWRLRGRPIVNIYTKLAAGLAAVLVIGFVGWQMLPGQGGNVGGGGQPSPSPSPTATIPPSPTATIAALPQGSLDAGTYRLRPSGSGTMTIDATVPDGRWLGDGAIILPRGDNRPDGVEVAFFTAETINSDPCHWDKEGSGRAPQVGDIEVGPTVNDLAEALAASSAYEATTPVDVTLGGFSGKRLELRLTPDPSGCDTFEGEENQYFVFGGRDPILFAQGDDNTWQVTIVDVDGTRLIAVVVSYEETLPADLTAAQAIVDSVVITP